MTRPIQNGDALVFSQKATANAVGGPTLLISNVGFINDTDGAGVGMMVAVDSSGGWWTRRVDLSAYVGQNVLGMAFPMQGGSSVTGSWDMYLSDVSLVSTDGTVVPMITSQSVSGSLWNGCGGLNLSLASGPMPLSGSDAALGATFYLADHLGSAQMEFSSNGLPLSSSQFAPFGGEINAQPTANHYKFTGKERDTESGLDYFGARYYASSMGRFMSPDWSSKPEAVPYSSLANPQSLNLYSYVLNNPLSKADPDGHCPPGQDCGKITVTAAKQGDPVVTKTSDRTSSTATAKGEVNYTVNYAGKPMANTPVSESVSNKTTVDGKVTPVETTTRNDKTNSSGVVGDESTYTTKVGGPSMPGMGNIAAQNMADSAIVKDTTQILTITSPTGSVCSVTEQRSMTNVDSSGSPGSDWSMTLKSPQTQTATPAKPQ